ncbi:hypothetical protein ACOJBM_31960 [Rhizobium beringeri]
MAHGDISTKGAIACIQILVAIVARHDIDPGATAFSGEIAA